MKKIRLIGLFFIFFLAAFLIYQPNVLGASSPYDVPSKVKNNWSKTLGIKSFPMTSGKRIAYDVYSQKYTKGGYKIVSKDFGEGKQKYVNFQGWAVLQGYYRHTDTNNETYIVAQKVVGTSNLGEKKVFSTLKKNIDATEDLEYNNKGSGVWNECSANAKNKDNEADCNMRYENVGFDAYLPLDELFSDKDQSASWTLYLVKEVNGQIVYTPLNMPFTFDDTSYEKGHISLSSGVDGTSLQMNGTNVLRRTYARELPNSNIRGKYFTTGKFYTSVDVDESETAVWYGVKSPHDSNKTRWANTSYWNFGGRQALLSYRTEYTPNPEINQCKKPVKPEYRYSYKLDLEVTQVDGQTASKDSETTTRVDVKRKSYASERKAAIDEIQSDINSRKTNYDKLAKELKDLQKKESDLEKDLDKADGSDDYSKINKILKDLDKVRQDVANKQCNISTVQTEIDHYEKERDTVQSDEGKHSQIDTNLRVSFDGTQKGLQDVSLRENQEVTLVFNWKLPKDGTVLADINPSRNDFDGVKEQTYSNNTLDTPIYIATNAKMQKCVKDGEESVSEGIVRTLNSVTDGRTTYKERLKTKLTIPEEYKERRAGFGIEYDVTTEYENEDPLSDAKGVKQVDSYMPTSLEYLPYTNKTYKEISGYEVPLEQSSGDDIASSWKLPKYYVEEFSGNVFLNTNHKEINPNDNLLDGGNKWYLDFEQPDGDYSFTVVAKEAGVNKLTNCMTGIVEVSGSIVGDESGNDDFVKRNITPENPFPSGTGWNWSGKESVLYGMNKWYTNWYADPTEIPESQNVENYHLTPELLEQIRDFDKKRDGEIKLGDSMFKNINIP
ncbi:hypothetical protein [Terribacillus saccharophilus]|uniref:hypothetical protein n=1 Tax=Terribacillus saccharophilus TaxID=361277 RepID=UPI002989E25A|nr:hypothetical protein [Terribacillus saccharophilus]MCM3227699.1 hypothetical protein [Terribacillus saccharophilus]